MKILTKAEMTTSYHQLATDLFSLVSKLKDEVMEVNVKKMKLNKLYKYFQLIFGCTQ